MSNIIVEEFEVKLQAGHDTFLALAEIEKKYIEFIYQQSRYNQSRAAKMLGLSRGCLRMKLEQHFGDKYIGKRS